MGAIPVYHEQRNSRASSNRTKNIGSQQAGVFIMEDIQYLVQRAKEESFLFVIDSSKRDIRAYPSPSEYAIQFDAPFCNVFGFDLLNATIPRTEYTVERGKNTIVYDVDGERKTATVEPGDYNLVQLCEALNPLLDGVAIEPHSTPYQLRSRVRFYSPFAFRLVAEGSTLIKTLGFYDDTPVYDASLTGIAEERAFQGPFPGFDIQEVTSSASLRQPFVPSVSGTASKVLVHCTDGSVDVEIRIVDGLGNVYGTATVSGGAPESVVANGLPITAGVTYYLEITTVTDGAIYTSLPRENEPVAEVSDGDTWMPVDSGNAVACEVYASYNRYELESPGLVDLTGERHVIVRCEEIESHLHRGRKTESFHGGLGMVKLGGNGYQDQRFDFVSFPSRKLYDPIGKLKTLTFRLTKPDGSLYDTRGVDHTLLCVIKYYVHVQEATSPTMLNPEYTPSVTQHMVAKWGREIEQKDMERFRTSFRGGA